MRGAVPAVVHVVGVVHEVTPTVVNPNFEIGYAHAFDDEEVVVEPIGSEDVGEVYGRVKYLDKCSVGVGAELVADLQYETDIKDINGDT